MDGGPYAFSFRRRRRRRRRSHPFYYAFYTSNSLLLFQFSIFNFSFTLLEMGQAASSSSSFCTDLASADVSGKVEVGSSARWRVGGCGGGGGGGGDGDMTLWLPDECLAAVFGKLGCHERNTCSLVCRRWRAVDSKSRQRLVLLARSEASPFLPALLCRFSSVSVLSLKCSRKIVSIDDQALARIPTLLASLKKLKLKGCIDVTDDGLHAFSLHRPPLLTKLSFASCGFGAGGLVSVISNCPSLQDLTLKRLRKLDAQNAPLSFDRRHRLERLCIKDLHNARLFIPLLAAAKSLKALIVCRSSGNWDPLLESLQQGGETGSVTEIQMENVQMGDPGLVAIAAACPDLEVLYLSRASDCTDDGVSAIANSCRKLTKLHIDAWSRFGIRTIGDDRVLSIATRCANLLEVVLMGIPATIGSFNVLASNFPALDRMAGVHRRQIHSPEEALLLLSRCNSFEDASMLLEELWLLDNQVYGVAHGLLMGYGDNVWIQAQSLFDEVKHMDSSTASAFYNALTDMLWHFGQVSFGGVVVILVVGFESRICILKN